MQEIGTAAAAGSLFFGGLTRLIGGGKRVKIPEVKGNSTEESFDEIRKRVLKNIDDSRLAREASGYKEWASSIDEGASKAESIPKRPSWRQSELDVQSDFPEYSPQKSFIDGDEVPYGTKGSSRPDFYKEGASIEVKNYKVTTPEGRSRLVNNISKQVNKRIKDLPSGTSQTIIIDVRGQNVSNDVLRSIRDKILEKSDVNVNIQFKR